MPGAVTLRDGRIIDRWSVIIENGQGNTEKVFRDTEKSIQDSYVQGIRIERVKIRPSFLKGLLGIKRDYLMVMYGSHRDYRIFIGANDFGIGLAVNWFLTCEPGFIKRALSGILTKGVSDRALSFSIDPFKLQNLYSFASMVFHSLLKAVDKLMIDLNQDPSTIERRTRGFLGIS